jgi:hypothetical protein
MAPTDPVPELDPRYSSEGARPTEWWRARERFADARVYWLTTIRPGGGPHLTPLLSVWLDELAHFCTGPLERKARNIARSPRCALVAGCDSAEGLDIVIEGDAVRVTDEDRLRRLADAWVAKYGEEWRFEVRDGAFAHDAGGAHVFAVVPARAYGFGKGEPYSQTRWRFAG